MSDDFEEIPWKEEKTAEEDWGVVNWKPKDSENQENPLTEELEAAQSIAAVLAIVRKQFVQLLQQESFQWLDENDIDVFLEFVCHVSEYNSVHALKAEVEVMLMWPINELMEHIWEVRRKAVVSDGTAYGAYEQAKKEAREQQEGGE